MWIRIYPSKSKPWYCASDWTAQGTRCAMGMGRRVTITDRKVNAGNLCPNILPQETDSESGWRLVIEKDAVERDFCSYPRPIANSAFTHQMLGAVINTMWQEKLVERKKTFNFYQDNVSLLFSFLRQDSPAGCNCRWELLARGKHSLQSGDFTWVPSTLWNRQCWGVQGCRLKKVQEHLQPLYAHSSLLGTSLLS